MSSLAEMSHSFVEMATDVVLEGDQGCEEGGKEVKKYVAMVFLHFWSNKQS
jgi:hypothetical protein